MMYPGRVANSLAFSAADRLFGIAAAPSSRELRNNASRRVRDKVMRGTFPYCFEPHIEALCLKVSTGIRNSFIGAVERDRIKCLA